ncbi:beta-propeller fold lactonase family protein [Lutibacter holmesii]|uniref:Beta-propeller fold lactonase family protein n=1 Tax=Lutibacter holmesii TaxID=1137985 RepID=A0ABW3WPL1_9FLAO
MGILVVFLVAISPLIARIPSYTIKTNGKLYIVNKLSSSITVFDLFEGKKIVEIPIKVTPHEPIAIADQNRLVVTNYGTASVSGKSLTVINTKTNTIEKKIDLKESLAPHGIIDFPNSNNVGVVTDLGNDLLEVNIETGEIVKRILTEQIVSHLVVLHPKKPLAYITNTYSGSVSVINLDLDKVIKIIPCGKGTEGIDITPNGKEVWVTNIKENTISIINTETNKITHTLPTGQESYRLKFSVDGNYCLVPNSRDGTISVYHTSTKKQIKTILVRGKVNFIERFLFHTPRPVGLLIHPNGLYAFVTNSNANEVIVLDMKTFTIVSTIGTENVPDGMAIVE